MWHISFTLADTDNTYLREFWTTNVVVSNIWILGFNTSFAKLSFWPVEKLSLNGNPLDITFDSRFVNVLIAATDFSSYYLLSGLLEILFLD
jgi:hypothetical protein